MHLDSGSISGSPAAVTAKRQELQDPKLSQVSEFRKHYRASAGELQTMSMQKMCADVEFRGIKTMPQICEVQNKTKGKTAITERSQKGSKGLYQEWSTGAYFYTWKDHGQ
ncbi:hypothetical protein MRB53_001192 [Persea americana]|uniref:Uncharacterized protein n=1 Tax=Persea americana TaxID=3435 RepID=A0ACC2MR48_PERAE|nr:hypothetical protein MRB53_001192 [Persea americana]